MATIVSQGASATVSLPAGSNIAVTGTGFAVMGPGRLKGTQYGLQGSTRVGPFDTAQTVYLTSTTTALSYTIAPGYVGAGPVQTARNADGTPSGLIDPATGQAVGGGDLTSLSVYTPTTQDQAGIVAAIAAAAAAGGGVVQLKAQTYTLTSMITLVSGVVIRGAGWTSQNSDTLIITAGTIIVGDGTFPLFGYNTVDLGAPMASGTALLNSMLVSSGVNDLVLRNGSYGIKVGAKYAGGPGYCLFKNLAIQNCTSWGMWLENLGHTTVQDVTAVSCGGNIAIGASGTALYNFGNSRVVGITGGSPTNNRHLWYFARQSSQMNNLSSFDLGGSGTGPNSTQAATMTNGNANIGVTDLSKFGVGMPVTVSASTNGFAKNTIYFVTSMSAATGAGTLTLALGMTSGANITPNASNAVNIITQGWPVFEMGGADAGCVFTGCSVTGASDFEAGGTSRVVLQGLRACSAQFGTVGQGGSSTQAITLRDCDERTTIICTASVNIDSTASYILQGAEPGVTNGGPTGVLNRPSSKGALWLTNGNQPTLYANSFFFGLLQFTTEFAMNGSSQGSGTTLTAGHGTLINFATAAGGTLTLPGGLTTNMVGWMFWIANPQANAVTINGNGSNIVGKGVSGASVSLAANTCGLFILQNNGGTLYWAQFV